MRSGKGLRCGGLISICAGVRRVSVMPTYKLTYFNSRGLGEPIRFIFAQAGVEYEDKRVAGGEAGEEWAQLKPSTPTGKLPILEVDGKTLYGSGPIGRFLGERFGLGGSNDLENAEIAGFLDFFDDFFKKTFPYFMEKDETKKAEIKKNIEDNEIPKYTNLLEKIVNSTSGNFIFGENVTYGDLSFVAISSSLMEIFPSYLEGCPGLSKVKESVDNLPNIAHWLKERPKTNV